ncbi:MAG: response regulator [Pseudomonadota bacterium]|nr:response regulator [Pseudomonadota bacterium]
MFHADPKLMAQLSTQLGRVLVVDPYEAYAKSCADMLRGIGAGQVEVMEHSRAAYERLESFQPDLIMTEFKGPGVYGFFLKRKLRKSNFGCRRSAVIVATLEATAQDITAARDAGAHEFLRKPYSATDLFKRVENVCLKPRPWIEAVEYIGPDRRRFNSGQYKGPRKRKSDAEERADLTYGDRVAQALKILRSAVAYNGSDRAQVARAIRTQVEELTAIALHAGDPRMAHAVAALGQHLDMVVRTGGAALVDGDASPFTMVALAGAALQARTKAALAKEVKEEDAA